MLYSANIYSQDIHFSQFYNLPMTINPASTGVFDGDWQASMGYRNQWKSIGQPFQTLAGSYERQMYAYNQHFSLGGYLLRDNTGNVALKSTQFVASGAYHKTVNNHMLHAGLQVGYMFRIVDYGMITVPGQFNSGTGQFDSSLPSELENGDKLSYLDINFGFLWEKKYGKFKPEAGFSLYHLNNPKESFYDDDNHLPMKTAFQAALKYDVSPSLYIQPRMYLLNQTKARDYIVGSSAGLAVVPNSSGVREIFGGLYLRNTLAGKTDAMIVMAGALVRNIQVGISYDLNVSSLKSYTNSRGAFELTIIYRSISTVLNTFSIPCERF